MGDSLQEQDICLQDPVNRMFSWIPEEYCVDEVLPMAVWSESATPWGRGSRSSWIPRENVHGSWGFGTWLPLRLLPTQATLILWFCGLMRSYLHHRLWFNVLQLQWHLMSKLMLLYLDTAKTGHYSTCARKKVTYTSHIVFCNRLKWTFPDFYRV